jgi:hypothetical protein
MEKLLKQCTQWKGKRERMRETEREKGRQRSREGERERERERETRTETETETERKSVWFILGRAFQSVKGANTPPECLQPSRDARMSHDEQTLQKRTVVLCVCIAIRQPHHGI